MFIFNIKFDKSKISKAVICVVAIAIIIALFIFIYSTTKNGSITYVKDNPPQNEFIEITTANYTNILKDCSEHLDNYVGKKIKFTGFVHRLYDFSDNQFVLGREMIIDTFSNNKAQVVVVGFLCEYDKASSFSNDTWVEVEGAICKGFYHSEIPVVKVSNIKVVDCPKDQYVYPPDDGYVNTENL